MKTLTTGELHNLMGITYRRFDYAVRTVGMRAWHGAGNYRRWTPDEVRRFQVAAKLADASLIGAQPQTPTPLPRFLRLTLDGPPPLLDGYCWVDQEGHVHYGDTIALDDEGDSAILVRLTEMLPDDWSDEEDEWEDVPELEVPFVDIQVEER